MNNYVPHRIHAFFLSFYKEKLVDGLKEFTSLLDATGLPYEIYFIDNGENGVPEDGAVAKYVAGDNSSWEFSGWDAALDSLPEIRDEDLFVFCNDTFCFHRKWDLDSRDRFVNSFLRLVDFGGAGIAGEVNSFRRRFALGGVRMNRWVSTYLFALPGGLLNKMGGKLCVDEAMFDRLVLGVSEGKIHWGQDIDPILASHLDSWMFPKNRKRGWYNSYRTSTETKFGKIKAILNEKWVTACSESYGGRLFDARASAFARLRYRLNRILARADH
jgi:hypothetical protein